MPRLLIAVTSAAFLAASTVSAQTPSSDMVRDTAVYTTFVHEALGAAHPPSRQGRAEIQRFVRAYVEAHNKADATALMEAVKRSPDVSSVNDGQITRGWEGIRTQTDELTGKEGSFKVSIGTMDVTPLGPSHALVVAPTTITVTTAQGPVEARGAVTLVLEKAAGSWKIINEHYSTRPQQQ
jgi:uncharacterized protein (TIGR02246 family)